MSNDIAVSWSRVGVLWYRGEDTSAFSYNVMDWSELGVLRYRREGPIVFL